MKLKKIVVCLVAAAVVSCSLLRRKLVLRLRLEKGKTYGARMLTDQKINQTIEGREMEMDQSIGMVYAYHVQDVDAEGNMVIEVRYDSATFKQEGPMERSSTILPDPPLKSTPRRRALQGSSGRASS